MIADLSGTTIVMMIIALLIALVIHEFMHAYVGHLLGDTTAHDEGRLTLNPLSHIDPFMTVLLPIMTLILTGVPFLAAKPVPFNPDRVKYDEFGAALIAAAGPLSNLLLAIIGAILFNATSVGSPMIHDFLNIFVVLNVAIFVFNLLPIPPLDGSRVLYAFAPEPLQQFMRNIEPFGLFIIIGLVFFAGLGGFIGDLNQEIINLLP